MTTQHDQTGAAAGTVPATGESTVGRVADTAKTEASNVASTATDGARDVASEASTQAKAVASEAKQQLDRLDQPGTRRGSPAGRAAQLTSGRAAPHTVRAVHVPSSRAGPRRRGRSSGT